MGNFVHTHDLKKNALSRAGELDDGNSPYDATAVKYLNQIYQAIIAGGNEFDVELGEPWIWAKERHPGILILNIPYETGTVSLTNGSASGTFSSAPAASQAGKFMKITGRPEYFRIASHTAASTSFTLDANYTDTTGSGLSYKAYSLEYSLASGIERLIGPMRVYRGQDFNLIESGLIHGVDLQALNAEYPMRELATGTPTMFSQVHRDHEGLIHLRMNKSVDTQTKVEYDHISIQGDLVDKTFATTDVTTATDLITITDHGLVDDERVMFLTTGTIPAGLSTATIYYVVSATQNTFKVSATSGGSAVDITSQGAGTHRVTNIPLVPKSFRTVLEFGAAFYLLSEKEDSEATTYFQLTQAKMRAMVKANRRELHHINKKYFGQLIPRLSQVSSRRRFTQEVSS